MKKVSLLIVTTILTSTIAEKGMAVSEPEPSVNQVEVGGGYVTDDAYYLGRYNGRDHSGAYILGDIKAEQYLEDGKFWRARGTNLGLESRYLRLEAGIQGDMEFFFEYDQLPNFRNDTAKTPFLFAGNNTLPLPNGFNINTNLNSNLNNFDLETERRRFGLGAAFVTRKYWKLDMSFHQDNKQGTDQIGSAMANGSAQLVGNTTTSLLPKPIDHSTTLADVSLSYAKDNAQLELAYHMSLFDNDDSSVLWQDPFNPARFGRQALEPDNEFHQVSLTGGYQLPYRSHLSGVISVGRMKQDEDFEAFSTDAALAGALPRSNLDGEVWLTTGRVKLASRPLRKLRVSAEYVYNNRDNDTPTNTYNYVVADSFTGLPVQNNPLSFTRNRANLTADYRFNSITSLQGGYKYDHMSRNYDNVDQERDTTRENTVFGKWKIRPHATVNMAVYGEHGDRAGSDYQPVPNENTALRRYNLATRDRDKLGTTLDYMPTDRLNFVLTAEYTKDDFGNTEIGLTESERPSYTLDVSYQPRRNITTYAYFTREYFKSEQRGSASGAAIADWEADFDDKVNTFGIGAKVTRILRKWDAGADFVYTRATGDVDMNDFTAPGTETPYPDLKTSLSSVELWTLYHQRPNLAWKFSYWYDDFTSDNWALDDLQVDSITNALLLGQESPDYNTHAVAASMIYKFD